MLLLNKYLKTSWLIASLFLFKNLYYCQNLIQNDSFETYANIDCGGGGLYNYSSSFPFPHVVDNWEPIQSPDYYNLVCNNIYSGVPQNIIGNQYPKQGNAYVGAIMFQAVGDLKEYFYQQLQVPLQAGKQYCLSFWVSRADGATHAIHSIGAYISNNLPPASGSTGSYISVIPQVVNQNGFITDTVSWTNIQGCFVANGGEQYITFGNFNSNANTDTLNVGSLNPTPSSDRQAYYYFDDISLVEDLTSGLMSSSAIENKLSVYPNPTTGILNISISPFDSTQGDKKEIKIINVLGEAVSSSVVENKHTSINISALQAGVYFVNIYNNNQLLGVKKIVKQE